MIIFAPFPIPVIVEGLGNAMVIYIVHNPIHENDEVTVALEDGGQWRHTTTDKIKSWLNQTYNISKKQFNG